MTNRKPRRRPVRSDDLADLQRIWDEAARRDAAETNTKPTQKRRSENGLGN